MFHTKHCAHHSVYKKLDTCSCTLFHFSHQTLYHHSVYEKINIWIQHFSHHTLCTSLVVLRLQIYSCTALFTPYIVLITFKEFHTHTALFTPYNVWVSVKSLTSDEHSVNITPNKFHTHTELFTPYNVWVCEWNFLPVMSTVWTSLVISFTLTLHFSHHTLCTLLIRRLTLTHCTFQTMPVIWEFHVFILVKSMLCHILLKKSIINLLHACFTFYEKKNCLNLVCSDIHKGLFTLLLKMVMQPGAACTVKISHKICVYILHILYLCTIL